MNRVPLVAARRATGTLGVMRICFAILALSGATSALAAESQVGKLHAYPVAANVYVLNRGTLESPSGSSITVLVGSDGVLLVNAQNDEEAALAAIKTLSDKPVRYVIHTGCDTAGGSTFTHDRATIVAHDTVRRRLEAGKCEKDPAARPTLTFDSVLTIHFEHEEVRVVALPVGHTDGDSLVHFTQANVAVTGDFFYSHNLPAYSKYAGGNMLGVNEQLHKIIELLPEDVTIIQGHGGLATLRDVRNASSTLDEVRDAISHQIEFGKTLAQMRDMNLLAQWKDQLDRPGGPSSSSYLKFYFDCLTEPPDPKFQL